jgi:hypothetical protein
VPPGDRLPRGADLYFLARRAVSQGHSEVQATVNGRRRTPLCYGVLAGGGELRRPCVLPVVGVGRV